MHFTQLNVGEQIMQQIRFGWNLLLSQRNYEEARLHFISAVAHFPQSPFVSREMAAMVALAHVLDDSKLYQADDQSGNWAHITAPKPTSDAATLEAWEMFAMMRYKTPRGFLSEDEPELLAAGMPAHAFIPVGDMQALNGHALGSRVFEHRLQHDIKVLRLLESKGLLRPKIASQAVEAYTRLIRSAHKVSEEVIEPTTEQWHSIYPFHNRRLYIHPCPRLVQALNPASLLETRLLSTSQKVTSRAGGFLSSGGALVIDKLLTPTAAGELRDFAELSTIWYQQKPTHLGAGLSTGFSPQLLAQVIEELRILLADVLCDLPLTHVWAFKLGDSRGTELLADQAAVHVHFWLSTDGSDESRGGITIYDATTDVDSIPVEAASDGNVLEELVRQRDGNNISIACLPNRAVVFDGARIYAEQPSIQKSGAKESEGQMSVSLLFGRKGLYCPLRRSIRLTFESEVSNLSDGSTSNG